MAFLTYGDVKSVRLFTPRCPHTSRTVGEHGQEVKVTSAAAVGY